MKAPAPVVTGIAPNEAHPGTKITIRGENFGASQSELFGVNILGADCMMTAQWMSPSKIIALCPAKEGKGTYFKTHMDFLFTKMKRILKVQIVIKNKLF